MQEWAPCRQMAERLEIAKHLTRGFAAGGPAIEHPVRFSTLIARSYRSASPNP
jgi:hypothetical protein